MRSTETSQAAVAPATVPPVGPVPGEGESVGTVRLPGLSLVVRSHRSPGGLEPALYVHGLGGSSQNWSALMAELAGTVDSRAPDLPGFGHSPPPDDGDYSLAAHARAVVRLLDRERRGPVHLFGNSMGGAVAVKVAAARPDLVRTLTLVSPALPEVPPQRTAWPTALASVPGLPRLYMRATRQWPAERRAAAMFALCYGDPARVGERARADAAAEYRRRMELPYFWDALIRSTRGIVNAYTLGGQHALWRQAERVLAPTLLVYGGRDKLVSVHKARRAARAFRDPRLLIIPSGGHVAMMEHPALVARAFRDMLDEVRGPHAAARPPLPGGAHGTGSTGDTGETGDTGTDTGPTTAAATGS
jgi:pimeloyl-ACP methyl ester carboxylesterase